MKITVDVDEIKERMNREIGQGIVSATYGMLMNPCVNLGKAEAFMEILEIGGVEFKRNSKEREKLEKLKKKIWNK